MIEKRGKKGIYSYRFRFAGRIIHESARTTSKTLARDAERQRRRELEQTYNKVEKRTLPPTFSKAGQTWLDSVTVSEASKETYGFALAHLKRSFGAMLVCDITKEDIAKYQQRRLQDAAAATVNKEIICLGSILRDCGVWHNIKRKKKDVVLLDEGEGKGRALSPEEEKELLAAAANIGQQEHRQGHWSPIYPATVLGLNTGMRGCEIRQLHWEQIDLEAKVLIVGKSKTKAGSGRCVPLNQPAWAALDMWASKFPKRQPEHFAFPACENGHIAPAKPVSSWRTAWNRTCSTAKLVGLGFHSLRHSATTKLLENGVPFAVVAQIMGWSASTAVRMAKRYGHIRPVVQKAALDGIATAQIPAGVHQIVHQIGGVVKSTVAN